MQVDAGANLYISPSLICAITPKILPADVTKDTERFDTYRRAVK
jgi:hypothetical protein